MIHLENRLAQRHSSLHGGATCVYVQPSHLPLSVSHSSLHPGTRVTQRSCTLTLCRGQAGLKVRPEGDFYVQHFLPFRAGILAWKSASLQTSGTGSPGRPAAEPDGQGTTRGSEAALQAAGVRGPVCVEGGLRTRQGHAQLSEGEKISTDFSF